MSALPPPRGEAAAVAGVVLAGVIAIFTTPGTFEPMDTVFGVTLACILFAYGREPSVTGARGLAFAGALGLALVLSVGWPADSRLPFSTADWLTFWAWLVFAATTFFARVLWNPPTRAEPEPSLRR